MAIVKQLKEKEGNIEIFPITHIGAVIGSESKQDKLTAGTGIKIDSANTITCTVTGETYQDAWIRTAISGITTALTENSTAISDEATARVNADTTLQTNIDNEATTRANADSTLQGNIDAETTARSSADSALGTRIDTITTELTSEINARISGDTYLEEEISTTPLTEDVSTIESSSLIVESVNFTVDKTSDTSSSFVLDANKYYIFGTRTTLTVSFNTGTSGVLNEYVFEFNSGSVATTLNVPSSVTWAKQPSIQANKKYQVSIVNNLGVIGEWS